MSDEQLAEWVRTLNVIRLIRWLLLAFAVVVYFADLGWFSIRSAADAVLTGDTVADKLRGARVIGGAYAGFALFGLLGSVQWAMERELRSRNAPIP